MPTRAEFAASIKAKYPAYKDVDDSTLVEKMLEKYPQYRDRVTDTPAAGMGDLKVAESQAAPAPAPTGNALGALAGPVAQFGVKAGMAGLKFAGNVAQALSTGPINAVAQGIQDDAGIMGTARNVARAVVDPVIPGPTPIQSTETTLARAGVDNAPRQSTSMVPGFVMKSRARAFEGGLKPEDADRFQDSEMYPETVAQPGVAKEFGFMADVGTPLYGLAAVKAAGVAARAALRSKPVQAVQDAAGEVLQKAGSDQMKRVVVPLMRHERKAKKPINDVIFEYGLDKADDAAKGANPETMFGRADAKLKDLSSQLKARVKAGKDAGARVDMERIIREAVEEVKAGAGDTPSFYEMIEDLDEVAKGISAKARAANPNGKLDLVQGQAFKQYAGTKGAWEKYARDKGIQVTSKESVESRLMESIYHKLNDQIDELAPDGIRDINRQISELIPAHQALGWRQLIDNRKAKFSMTDALGVMATAIDPKMAAFYGLKKASQSGTVASKMFRLGEAMKAGKQSPKAETLWKALQKPLKEAPKQRLIQLLETELDLDPANTIPLHPKKVAEEDEDTSTLSMRSR